MTSGPELFAVAEEYLAPLKAADVDTLVLGCTHYPLMSAAIQYVMGPDVRLVDSAAETAREVTEMLDELGLRRTSGATPAHVFAASDAPLRFREVGRTFVGDRLAAVEHIDAEAFAAAAAAIAATPAGQAVGR